MKLIDKKGQSEDRLNQICFLWFTNTYPELRGLLFHVPNGGNRNAREAYKFKTMGLTPGVSDFLFMYKGITHCIELKTLVGNQSKVQKKWEDVVTKHGFPYYIIRSRNAFQELVEFLINQYK